MIAQMKTLSRCMVTSLALLFLLMGASAQAQTAGEKVDSGLVPMVLPPPDDEELYNDAGFISQSVPAAMAANGLYGVQVRMYNSGTTAWSSGQGHVLGSQNPQDNATWGLTRAGLATTIYVNGQGTFSFQVKAPGVPGTYNFQWRMLQGGAWFGELTPNVVVTVSGPPTLTVQRTPSTVTAGTGYTVSWSSTDATTVAYNCTAAGSGYNASASVALSGSAGGTASAAWVGYPSTCTWTASGPGGTKTVTETMTTIAAPYNDAQVVGQSVPAAMTAGQGYTVSVTVQNNGTTTWSAADGFMLGSQNPAGNQTWNGGSVALGATVAPGQQATFTFGVVAPAPGSYSMQWQMLRSGVAWFGATSSSPVTVSAPPPPTLTVQRTPSTVTAGTGYTVNWSSTEASAVAYNCTAAGTIATTPMLVLTRPSGERSCGSANASNDSRTASASASAVAASVSAAIITKSSPP